MRALLPSRPTDHMGDQHVQLYWARVEELQGEGKEMAMSEKAESEAKLTYEGFCAPVRAKCDFLLSLRTDNRGHSEESDADRPVALKMERQWGNETPAFEIANKVTEVVRLVRSNSSKHRSEGEEADSLDPVKSLFSVYQTLQHWAVHKQQQQRNQEEDSLIDVAALFVQSSEPLETFRSLITVHVERANARAEALHTIRAMLTDLKSDSARVGILASWGPPFRAYCNCTAEAAMKEQPDGSHHMAGIESCGPQPRRAAVPAFSELYTMLARMLSDEKAPLAIRVLAADDWAVPFTTADHALVRATKVTGTLSAISSDMAVPQILRDICATAAKLLEYSFVSLDERKEQEEQGEAEEGKAAGKEAASEAEAEEEGEDGGEGGQGVGQAGKTGADEAEKKSSDSAAAVGEQEKQEVNR